MSALYQLTADLQAVASRLEELELDAETIRDTLDGYADEFENKVVSIASLIRNIESTAASIKEAEAGMALRRKHMEARAEWLRQYVIDNMKAIGKEEVSCPLFAIKVKTNVPCVVIAEGAVIPAEFVRQKTELVTDKKAIKAALESGVVLDGISLVRSNTLSIK